MRLVVIYTSLLATLIAIAEPEAAPRVALLLAGVLSVSWVAQHLQRLGAALPARSVKNDVPTATPSATALPHELTFLINEIRPASAAFSSSVGLYAHGALRQLARAKLRTQYGLDPFNPEDSEPIARIVSPTLFELMRPDDPTSDRAPWVLPRAALEPILDELERL